MSCSVKVEVGQGSRSKWHQAPLTRKTQYLDNLDGSMINDPKEFSCHACICLQSIDLDSLEETVAFSAAVFRTWSEM